jgi:glyoxylase-like metal-dependent hydrolase (beta-lactamase superfamily II)
MKIHLLHSPGAVYSGNAYLVLGDSNKLDDVNSLVDVGTDGSIVYAIAYIWTGVGKKPVDRVVLTHSHFDHAGGLSKIRSAYQPETCAFTLIEGIQRQLVNGDILRLGDEEFEVLSCPEHSSDSICLYSARTGVLFSGDTPLGIRTPGGTYSEGFVPFLEDLLHRGVKAIYSGHDHPNVHNAQEMIGETLQNVRRSAAITHAEAGAL